MRSMLRLAIFTAVVFALGVGAVAYALSNLGSVPFVNGHCVAGLQGAAVSVTVDGPTATSQCQSFAGQVTDGGSWYIYKSGTEPGGAVICQYTYSGDTVTVRDQGVANLYGTSVCSYVHDRAAVAAVPLEPIDASIGPTETSLDESTSDGGAYDEQCILALGNYNVRLQVIGNLGLCDAVKGQLLSIGVWYEVADATSSSDRLICSGVFVNGTLDVYDSGGAMYGTQVCQRYGFVSQ
jgi:hypothetical protein